MNKCKKCKVELTEENKCEGCNMCKEHCICKEKEDCKNCSCKCD